MNVEKLIKLLNMTQSLNDNEALNAVRLANRLMNEAQMTWDVVFNTPPQSTDDSAYSKEEHQKLNNAFQFIFENAHLWKTFDPSFVKSLHEQFLNGSILSEKQFESFVKIYKKIKTLVEKQ